MLRHTKPHSQKNAPAAPIRGICPRCRLQQPLRPQPPRHSRRRVKDDRSKQLEIDLRSLSESLRDVEGRLTRKGERLAELERELANSRAERAAADEHAVKLLNAAEERGASMLHAAEERGTALLRAAEERTTALASELAAARTELSAESARAFNLQSSVEQFQTTVRSHEAHAYEVAKLLASREQQARRAPQGSGFGRDSLGELSRDAAVARRPPQHFRRAAARSRWRSSAKRDDSSSQSLRAELAAQNSRARGSRGNDLAERQKRIEVTRA